MSANPNLSQRRLTRIRMNDILNCVQTLKRAWGEAWAVHDIFLKDTKAGVQQDARCTRGKEFIYQIFLFTMLIHFQAKAAERKDAETTKAVIVQVDDLLTFREFSKKSADGAIDVNPAIISRLFRIRFYWRTSSFIQYDEDVGRATSAVGEVREDFISNLSRISQLTWWVLWVFSSHPAISEVVRLLGPNLRWGICKNARVRHHARWVLLLV